MVSHGITFLRTLVAPVIAQHAARSVRKVRHVVTAVYRENTLVTRKKDVPVMGNQVIYALATRAGRWMF
jgi:hypothetical protein